MRIFICLSTLLFSAAHADVTDATANGFTSTHELVINAEPDEVFTVLTSGISAWWDASHSYGGEAQGFSLDARAGGCFCEQLANGGVVEHMRVVHVQPGILLTLQGGLGPLQNMGVAGSMSFRLSAHAAGTKLNYQYVVGGYVAGGLLGMAKPVDQVQLGQLNRLRQFLNTGVPPNG